MPTPVFILDGIWGWHPRWEGLRKRLDRDIGPARIWSYDNSGRRSLEFEAAKLVTDLRALGEPFHLVGYSMGGLVVREAIRQAPDLPLARAALLHSPHAGSLAAHVIPHLPACREMRPGSHFLRRLDAHEWNFPTLVTWCAEDLSVVPGRSAAWPRATLTHRSPVPAHIWPVFSRGIHRRIAEFLAAHRLPDSLAA